MKKIFVITIIALTMLLTACDSRDDEFAHLFEPDNEAPISSPDENGMGNGGSYDVDTEAANGLEGTLTVMLREFAHDSELQFYADLFRELHPNVSINFEFYGFQTDMADQLALATRLIADPPDILVHSASIQGSNFEKMSMETLFVNLYDKFDGPRGINMDDYFSNIFLASEEQGGLFGVPILFELMLAYPNLRLLDAVGIDPSAILSVSVDDEIELHSLIAAAFPDETIHPSPRFSFYRALTAYPIYDLDTGIVSVNTPEMAERMRRAKEIPINEVFVVFTPDVVMEFAQGGNTWARYLIRESNILFMDHFDGGNHMLSALFMQVHPDIQFGKPIPFAFGSPENIGFFTSHILSIMRESSNTDLAWEFVRFIMEYEESAVCPVTYSNHLIRDDESDDYLEVLTYHNAMASIPINRNRFNNQVYDALQVIFVDALSFTDLENHVPIPLAEFRAQQIEYAMNYVRDITERLNFRAALNFPVIMSLVYPDIWLVYTGQQTIEQALENIQNRLELYVHE